MLVRLALIAAAVSGCGSVDPPALAAPPPVGTTVGPWARLPDPPLTPRHGALAVWTGDEVVVLGGDTTPPCPSNALCVGREGPVDGAAYDPVGGSWRPIAIGSDLYVSTIDTLARFDGSTSNVDVDRPMKWKSRLQTDVRPRRPCLPEVGATCER